MAKPLVGGSACFLVASSPDSEPSRRQSRFLDLVLHSTILLALLALVCFTLPAPTIAQQYPYSGFPPFSTQVGGPYDLINLANSNIALMLPLRSKAGPIPLSSVLFGASNAYYYLDGSAYAWRVTTPLFAPIFANVEAGVTYQLSSINYCNNQPDNNYSAFAVRDSYGTVHPLPLSLIIDMDGCIPLPNGPVQTTDGSGYNVVFTGRISYVLYDKFGNSFPSSSSTITTPDGVTIQVSNQGGTFTDPLSSIPVLATNWGAVGQPTDYTYTDAAGHIQTYTVNYTSVTQVTNFGCYVNTPNGPSAVLEFGPITTYLPTSITTPDGGTYSISYETTPNYSSTKYPPPYVTGRIAEIKPPWGGYIEYSYSGGNNGINCGSWTVPTLRRTVSADSPHHAYTWTYVMSTNGAVETDPAGNQTVHIFRGQIQTQSTSYEGGCPTTISGCNGGGTLLKTVTTCFDGSFSNCPAQAPIPPISQTDVYTSYDGGPSKLVETKYDTTFGDVQEVKQYDYGAAMPPTGSPISDTVISYGQSWNGSSCSSYPSGNYIHSTPCYIHIMNSSGVDVSKTQIAYSNTGHPVTISQWVSGSNWLTSTATYNSNGTIATSTDVNQALSTYSYYGTGGCNGLLPTSVTVTGAGLPSGGLTTSSQWDCNGGVQTSTTDANGKTTTTNYQANSTADPLYRPVSVVDPLGNATDYGYTLTSFEHAMNFGSSTSDVLTTTDGLHRPIYVQTRQGPNSSTFDSTETSYGWTSTGPTTSVSAAYPGNAGQLAPGGTGFTVTQYDALHRPLSITDADGGTVSYSYTENDVLQTIGPAPSGENPKRRQFEYDGAGRLTSVCEVTSALGSGAGSCGQSNSETGILTKYTYDALGDLLSSTENAQPGAIGGQQTRTYAYDGLGRLSSESNPELTAAETYSYDSACGSFSASAGDLTKIVDAAANNICVGYDGLHRPTGIAYPSGPNSSSTPPKSYIYDSTTFTCPTGSYVKGRLAEAFTGSSSSKITDLAFCYSPRGEVTDAYQKSGASGGYYHTTESYYANGVVNQLGGVPGLTALTYGLDGEGRPNSLSAASGQNPVTNLMYNPFSNPTSVTFGSGDTDTFNYDSNTDRMTNFTFNIGGRSFIGIPTWNPNGSLGQLQITDPVDSSDNQTCNYSHDDLARVTTMNCGPVGTQNFTYDAFGNINKAGGNNFQPTYSTSTNRISTLNGFSVQYDANGNLLNDGVNSYTWNADGRPTSLNSVDWTLDAFGREIERSVGSAYQQMVYTPTGEPLATMTGQIFSRAWVPLPGGGTAVYDYSVQNNGLYFYRHPDWLGSSRVTSTPNQAYAETQAFMPFGETYIVDGSGDVAFTGQNSLNVSGVFEFPAREYSATQGRWISPDPAGLNAVDAGDPQTLNRYAYVRNSPLNRVDPSGLDGDEDCWWGNFCTLYGFPIYPPPPIPSGFVAPPTPPIDWQTLVFGPFNPSLLIFNWHINPSTGQVEPDNGDQYCDENGNCSDYYWNADLWAWTPNPPPTPSEKRLRNLASQVYQRAAPAANPCAIAQWYYYSALVATGTADILDLGEIPGWIDTIEESNAAKSAAKLKKWLMRVGLYGSLLTTLSNKVDKTCQALQ
jgi:RHS repeat-associated protein